MEIKNLVENYSGEMIETLAQLVSFNSVFDESNELYPFGVENALCLNKALDIISEFGMDVHNLDNYIGYGEIGNGDEVIGIIGHLDIVPCGNGWNTDPLKATLIDGKIYGRGTSDDKGPVVAAMFAIKIIKDLNIPLNKKIRLIIGSNEETGGRCLEHYVKKMGHVDYGFTPDADFPGTFGEKGQIGASFSCENSKIIDIKGGAASNVVCNHVEITVNKNDLNIDLFVEKLTSFEMKHEIKQLDDRYIIDVFGVAAHASTPHLGKNAINYAIVALNESGFDDCFVKEYARLIGLTIDGSLIDCNFKDEYGDLTFNNGIIKKVNNIFSCTIDIRFPVTEKIANVKEKLLNNFLSDFLIIEVVAEVEPLFYDKNSKLIKSLVSAYQSATNDFQSQPNTMGGGTYAKGINNTIAFGGCFQGDEDVHMHDANEFIKLDNLLKQCEIYTLAIMNLLEL